MPLCICKKYTLEYFKNSRANVGSVDNATCTPTSRPYANLQRSGAFCHRNGPACRRATAARATATTGATNFSRAGGAARTRHKIPRCRFTCRPDKTSRNCRIGKPAETQTQAKAQCAGVTALCADAHASGRCAGRTDGHASIRCAGRADARTGGIGLKNEDDGSGAE